MASIRERAANAIGTWLGIPAYEPTPIAGSATLDATSVDRLRRQMGGQLEPMPATRPRWYIADVETAEYMADGGRLQMAAQIMRAARADGVLSGVLSTRTDGLVRLPKRFRGTAEIIRELQIGSDPENPHSTYDELMPPTELGMMAADGELVGVGVGELVPVAGREFPVLIRHDPEFLVYNWSENQWYFRSIAALIPITPGDGRWVLHFRGPKQSPWQGGVWKAVGRAYCRKSHANAHKDQWEAKLAHPARVAVAPAGAGEAQADDWFRKVMAWGVNTVFGMKPGYDVRLLESNGRGYDSFLKTIADCNEEFKICIAGQTVTTDGGAGFQNSDIHKSIRADLIKATADSLAHTINTQILPNYIEELWGYGSAVVEYDVTPPKDRSAEATSMQQVGVAIQTLTEALAPYQLQPDVSAICTQFGIPVRGDINGDGVPDEAVPELKLIQGGKDEEGPPEKVEVA